MVAIIVIARRVGLAFIVLPMDAERRRSWISFVSRQNADETPWEPGVYVLNMSCLKRSPTYLIVQIMCPPFMAKQ